MTLEWGKIVKSIDWTLVFNLINFGILLFVLQRLLFKPAMAYLDRRRDQVAARMTAAKSAEENAARLAQEREQELQGARERSNRILEETRTRSEKLIDEAKGRAEEEAARVLETARAEMARERDRMISDLKTAYAEIAVLGAERVLAREVRVEDHRRLLDQLLEGIDEETLKV